MWKRIPGFEGYYANELGNIKSLKGTYPQILHQFSDGGFVYVTMYKKDEGRKKRAVHHCVWSAFNGPTTDIIRHIDGNKSNNRLDNLVAVKRRDFYHGQEGDPVSDCSVHPGSVCDNGRGEQ